MNEACFDIIYEVSSIRGIRFDIQKLGLVGFFDSRALMRFLVNPFNLGWYSLAW
jgi:hypothetical protein